MANLIKNPGIAISNKKFGALVDRSITTVTAEDLAGVTKIGQGAFEQCQSLTSVVIPDNITTIETNAFLQCTNLQSVSIGAGVTVIPQNCFNTCSSLSNLSIAGALTELGESCFAYNIFTTFEIPSTVTRIRKTVFSGCTHLTRITIYATTPPTLDNANAFSYTNNCPIYVPVQSLNAYKTAANWSSLASRIQPIPSEGLAFTVGNDEARVTGIGTCTDTYVVIPRSYEEKPVTKIKQLAFDEETSITGIYIPDSVTTIENAAFRNCTGLITINIPSAVTSLGTAFNGCENLESAISIPSGNTEIGNYTFNYCSKIPSITIPEGVTRIGYGCMQFCQSLTSLVFPSTTTAIEAGACYSCFSLTSITILATTPPTLERSDAFNNTNNCPIYVPAESVSAYQSADVWSEWTSRIQAIPTT